VSKLKIPAKIKKALVLIFIAACFVIMFGGIFWFHYSTLRNAWELKAVEERGVETSAKVFKSTHSSGGGRSMESYTLDYEYEVDDKWYYKSKYVSRTYTEGGSVTIKYLPNNPKVSDIPGNTGLVNQWIQMIFFDIFGFIGLIFAFIKYRNLKREEEPPIIKDTGILDDIDTRK
jgi:hypothetical protein